MTHLARATALTVALTVALATLAATPSPARAQSGSMKVNIGAGASLTTGDFGNRNDLGYNLTLGIGSTPAHSQLGFRFEGIYNEFSANTSDAKSRAAGLLASATFNLSTATTAGTGNNLYIIGGGGYYSTRQPAIFGGSDNNMGYNIGAGFHFPLTGFSAYIEARYHSVSNADVKFIPITFGVVF